MFASAAVTSQALKIPTAAKRVVNMFCYCLAGIGPVRRTINRVYIPFSSQVIKPVPIRTSRALLVDVYRLVGAVMVIMTVVMALMNMAVQ